MEIGFKAEPEIASGQATSASAEYADPGGRRTDPAEPPTASHPIARTTAHPPTKNPETSQRTHIQRLKASPLSHTTRPASGSGIDPERALEAIQKKPAHSAKAHPPPSFPASAGPIPQSPPRHPTPSPEPQRRPPTKNQETSQRTHIQRLKASPPLPHHTPTRQPRDRAGASIGSDPQKTLRAAQKPILPRAYLRAQDRSRTAPHGIPPNRQNHSADPHREPRNLSAHPYPKAESLTPLPHHPQQAAAGSIRSEHWKRSTKNPAHSAKADPPPSFPASAGPIPHSPPTASHPIARTTAQTLTENPETSQHTHIQRLKASPLSHTTRPASGSGIGPERALEAIHKKNLRAAQKLILPRAYLRAQDRSRRAPTQRPTQQPTPQPAT